MADLSNPVIQLRAAVELSRLPGVGAAKFKALVDQHGSPFAALHQIPRQLALLGTKEKTGLTSAQLDGLFNLPPSVRFTYYGAADYPQQLLRLAEPPPYLFRKGSLWPLPPIAVAIVGPRDCSREGVLFAHTLAAQLAASGALIVSGGALGIDTAAHRGALASEGFSALVTATGIDRIYPRENQELFAQVMERGCLLTELLLGTPPRRDFFPTRNRIIVGLSDAVIIVEGKLHTGTWSSANHALKQHRPLFVWAESPRPELRELPKQLIERGAIALDMADTKAVMNAAAIRQNRTLPP
ncbi:DNA processing protein [Gammaproteobacteria bacterium]